MNMFLKISSAVVSSAMLTASFAAVTEAATLVQTATVSDTVTVDGSATAYPFSLSISSPFEAFSGTGLSEVTLGIDLTYAAAFACPSATGCALGISGTAEIPSLGISEDFSAGPETVPFGDAAVPPSTITETISISPDPLPLSLFEGAAGEPLFPGDLTVSGTLTSDPSIAGAAEFDLEASLSYITANGEVGDPTEVPEPATTAGLLIAGGMGWLAKRRKSAAIAETEK